MGELLADREILLEKTYQGKFYRIKTDQEVSRIVDQAISLP